MVSLPLVWMLTMSLALPSAVAADGGQVFAASSGNQTSGSPVWVTSSGDTQTIASGDTQFFVATADGPAGAPVWVVASADAPAAKGQKIVVRKLGDDEDDDADVDTAKVNSIDAGGPWLGVQFGPVPKPLATHLKVQSEVGQMILNVAENSPADSAGLQQYDVITQIDGQDVSAKIGEFMEKVRAFNPNETHTLSLLRGGQQTQAVITIGTRPDDFSNTKYKYETGMEDLAGNKVFGRGGMLEKDDQGNWVFKGFNMKNMPDVFKAMPDVGDMDFQFNFAVPGPGGQGQKVFVYKDKGTTLKINRDSDGKITVTRTEKDGGKANTTTTTYDNEDDLKAKDPDAYKAMTSGPQGLPGMPHKFGLFVPGPMDQDGQQWRDAAEQLKKHHEAMKKMGEEYPGMFVGVHKPRTSFETTPDGKIRVTVRHGEDELVENYNSADDLKAAKPDLYKKYERFQKRTAEKQPAQ